jgi:hypothetical protein
LPQRWINREPFSIVGVFITCQTAVEGLPQERDQRVLRILPRAPVTQKTIRHNSQT